jgi:hypothetical protein
MIVGIGNEAAQLHFIHWILGTVWMLTKILPEVLSAVIKILTSVTVEYITLHTYQRPKPGGRKLKNFFWIAGHCMIFPFERPHIWMTANFFLSATYLHYKS